MTHFNTSGTQTACKKPMLASETGTTSAFKSVTCPGCRQWLREKLLGPRGFSDPPQWETVS